jgi:hypothetical protein
MVGSLIARIARKKSLLNMRQQETERRSVDMLRPNGKSRRISLNTLNTDVNGLKKIKNRLLSRLRNTERKIVCDFWQTEVTQDVEEKAMRA